MRHNVKKTMKKRKQIDEDAEFSTPPEGVDTSPEGLEDHPLNAIKYAEEHGLGADDSVVKAFTPQEKDQLAKLIKHGEFNAREAAVLKALMCDAMGLEELGAFLGAASPRTKGQPMSKPAALKELNRILGVLAKRAYLKTGKKIDLTQIPKLKKQIKQQNIEKRKKAKELARKRRELMKQFWQELSELNKVQRAHGLPPSRYDKTWTQNTTSLDQLMAINKA